MPQCYQQHPCNIAGIHLLSVILPEEHSLSNGQVLMRNYTFEEAAVVVREMTDVLAVSYTHLGGVLISVLFAGEFIDTVIDLLREKICALILG